MRCPSRQHRAIQGSVPTPADSDRGRSLPEHRQIVGDVMPLALVGDEDVVRRLHPGSSSSAPRGTIAMPRSGSILAILEPQTSQIPGG